ncbi:MAG: type II secretion system F family protein [Firmicutes bacterium]|nr:type II secretion system F family protein [Bacillota bacterium]
MISSSVSAGRQLPQAVEEASRQLASSWGSESDIACEASEMAYRYGRMNEDIDLLWDSLAKRSGLEEISQFASSCRICRRSGGDLEDVCMKCSAVLLEKIAFGDELKALTAQRKLDIAVLTAMPVAMLIMLNILSYSYIEVLYTTIAGRIIMTAAAGLMAAALLWSLKISEVSI